MQAQPAKAPTRTASRLFVTRPDRITAAWRRARRALRPQQGGDNQLDSVVELFVREVGLMLAGQSGSPWSRCRGVLRLSLARGVSALYEEFATLRRCLVDALEVCDASVDEREQVHLAMDDAVDGAVSLFERLHRPNAPAPRVPFGGVVVETYEHAARPRPQAPAARKPATVH